MILTKEILKHNFGFEIHDMADFWQCELGEFVIIQPKFEIIKGHSLPFLVAGKDPITITTVLDLQINYKKIKGVELFWQE